MPHRPRRHENKRYERLGPFAAPRDSGLTSPMLPGRFQISRLHRVHAAPLPRTYSFSMHRMLFHTHASRSTESSESEHPRFQPALPITSRENTLPLRPSHLNLRLSYGRRSRREGDPCRTLENIDCFVVAQKAVKSKLPSPSRRAAVASGPTARKECRDPISYSPSADASPS